MVALLVLVIGVLALIGLLVAARSRPGGDPSSSVAAFHRALTAMEPGAARDRRAPDAGDGEDGHAGDRARSAH